jgi:hypothetical protein
MKTVRFLVILRIPDGMTAEQAHRDLMASIGFGRPVVICMSDRQQVVEIEDDDGSERKAAMARDINERYGEKQGVESDVAGSDPLP